MSLMWHTLAILLANLALFAAGVSAASLQQASPDRRPLEYAHGISQAQHVQAAPGWEQANDNGFGDAQVQEVSAVEAFNGYLYAGTYNPLDAASGLDGAQILRSADGQEWTAVTDPGFGNDHDTAPPAILDFAAFDGYLYAGTGRGDASQLWRSQNGIIWAPINVTGFSNPDNVAVAVLIQYKSMLYAGMGNKESGAQIWRSSTGENNSWTQVAPPAAVGVPGGVTGMAEFDGGLYAVVESEEEPAQVWRSFGGAWSPVVSDGFGDSNTVMSGGMAVFGGELYVGAGNTDSGAQLWRTSDGTTWEQAATPAAGDPNNEEVELLFVFQDYLYAGMKNGVSGIELWRTANGVQWEQANTDGFGDSNNTTTNGSNATAAFNGQLYVGTANSADGGELWRTLGAYGVQLSSDQEKVGLAGQDVSYTLTITNIGNMADTFDLTAVGQSWATTLSMAQVTLEPSASAEFTVTVAIPPEAVEGETDAVTIRATSQGDGGQSAEVVLTTTSTTVPEYGVTLSADESQSGLAGAQVHYTLTITNSGNTSDTYDLQLTGNNWTTEISTQTVTLAAGQNEELLVTVSIPATASAMQSDQVTVQAISQHDDSKSDSAVFVTTSVGHSMGVYMPVVMSAARP